MSLSRMAEVFRVELAFNVRRPLFWVLLVIVGFFAWMMPAGNATISSGNSAVGGTKAWLTSEFAVTQLLAMLITIIYSFFVSVGAGMSVMRDEDLKVGEVLHATPLTPGEYVWGKFLAQFATIGGVLAAHLVLMATFAHAIPRPGSEVIGPFVLSNYLRPALIFGLPTLLFYCGAAFALGARTRSAMLVFVAPFAAVLLFALFLWNWAPAWLDPRISWWLNLVDPAGLRWLSEVWLKVDRGVQFYNHDHVGIDLPFALSRVAFAALGVLSVVYAQRHFARRGKSEKVRAKRGATAPVAALPSDVAPDAFAPMRTLGMRTKAPGLLAGAFEIARVEIQELRTTPGLYLFVLIILLQALGGTLVGVGFLDTPLLNTPGTIAAALLNTLTLCLALLLLFYTVESLERERRTGLAPLTYAAPIRTTSLLLGKAIATTVVAAIVIAATLVGCWILLLVQGKVPFDLRPFFLLWGVLLLITLVMWSGFVGLVYSLTRNRITTYAIALAAVSVTGWFQMRNKMTWVWNWDLWDVARWSDLGVFEIDRTALILNRVVAVGLAVLFIALTVKLFPRVESDATRDVHRLRPGALLRGSIPFAALALVPMIAGFTLWTKVEGGFQGDGMNKKLRDYWKQNVMTWTDADLPAVSAVDLDIDLEPATRAFKVDGSYHLVNPLDRPLHKIPLSIGVHWDSVSWTMNGEKYVPENRSGLCVFTLAVPLAPGDSVTIGFRNSGKVPPGITRNGGRVPQFILPSGVVLTGFDGPMFVPFLGFQPGEMGGVEERSRPEPRVYADDFYEGENLGFLALGTRWFSTKMRVTVPTEYTVNATGVKLEDEVKDGKRTTYWESDHPVRLFNVVAGRWAVKKGDGAEVYYHPSHTYNVDEMLEALVASRRFYSEWFVPYPWRDLRLSEFASLSYYAQGSPTNITFSEGIGFLTKSESKAHAAFWITGHEAAHQWWGNILMPAEGPGNVILSEGMSHYSTMLLTDQVKGLQQRLAFCRQIEDSYGDNRRSDSERSLMLVDASRPGDNTVIYDKAGYVFWMLHQLMGRDAMFAAHRDLIETYRNADDHATLHDALQIWRKHAPDPAAYDAFVEQWFKKVVVPEYKLKGATRAKDGAAWTVKFEVRNDGTGLMPVEVAAVTGDRFDDKGAAKAGYRDVRQTVLLDKGEKRVVELRCPFEPSKVVVDPDYKVLQLERKNATVTL